MKTGKPPVTKEKIYDDQVNPLMAKILAICQKHKIAMLASFSIPTVDDPDLCVTSALLADEYEPPKEFGHSLNLIRNGFTAFTVSTKPE